MKHETGLFKKLFVMPKVQKLLTFEEVSAPGRAVQALARGLLLRSSEGRKSDLVAGMTSFRLFFYLREPWMWMNLC